MGKLDCTGRNKHGSFENDMCLWNMKNKERNWSYFFFGFNLIPVLTLMFKRLKVVWLLEYTFISKLFGECANDLLILCYKMEFSLKIRKIKILII